MSQDIQQGLDDLISYYQGLNNYYNKFPHFTSINYDALIEQLMEIRQLLIDKTTTNINSVYKPTEKLFASHDHFKILENTVQFYKHNIDEVYPIPETEMLEEMDSHKIDKFTDLQQSIDALKDHLVTDTKSIVSTQAYDNISIQLSEIKDLIHNLIGTDISQSIIKSNNNLLAIIKTNHELMKSDLTRYDTLLTEHINQSNMNIAEAIAKEHARFTHKISVDINAIVDGIITANNSELKSSLQKSENNLLKWFTIIFLMNGIMLFGTSFLSSSWTARKVVDNSKLVNLSITCKPNKPVTSHKSKFKSKDDEE